MCPSGCGCTSCVNNRLATAALALVASRLCGDGQGGSREASALAGLLRAQALHATRAMQRHAVLAATAAATRDVAVPETHGTTPEESSPCPSTPHSAPRRRSVSTGEGRVTKVAVVVHDKWFPPGRSFERFLVSGALPAVRLSPEAEYPPTCACATRPPAPVVASAGASHLEAPSRTHSSSSSSNSSVPFTPSHGAATKEHVWDTWCVCMDVLWWSSFFHDVHDVWVWVCASGSASASGFGSAWEIMRLTSCHWWLWRYMGGTGPRWRRRCSSLGAVEAAPL